MTTSTWKLTSGTGNWSNTADWTPAAPVNGADVFIGSSADTGNVVVTEDVTLAINSLTLAAKIGKNTTTLVLTPGYTLTVNATISLGSGTTIRGTGSLIANGAIIGAGAITASSGLLALSGSGSIASGGPTLSIGKAVPSTLELNLSGGVTTGAITISNANQTLMIGPAGSVTITQQEQIASGTLQMAGGVLTDSSGIVLGKSGAGATLKGFGTVNASLTRAGSGNDVVTAVGGTLDLRGSIAGAIVLAVDAAAPADLKIDGAATQNQAILINDPDQTLEIGATGSLTINAAQNVSNGKILLSGGTLTDSQGITLGNGATNGTLTGYGTVNANLGISGSGTSDIVIAAGGLLDLKGTVGSGVMLAIDAFAPAVLKIESTAVANNAVAITSVNQKLEIGALGSLTINATEAITNGTIQLDGGVLTDAGGVTLGSGAKLTGNGTGGAITLAGGTITQSGGALGLSSITGFGVVNGNPSVSGAITASGGLLDLTGNATLASGGYRINATAGSVLKLDGTAAAGTTFTFTGASGTLELADVANGVVQQFNGTIAGLGARNAVNIQGAVTSASLSGNTITVLNGATTVATLQLSATPAAGSKPTVVADGALGGYDVSLSDPSSIGGPPNYSHIVVVVEENHSYNEIIGNAANAPYINNILVPGGALLTNYFALTHPSEPNYFALYAGSTFGVTDDNYHAEPDPTLYTILATAGLSFTGYVETPNSDQNHDPWFYFPEGTSVETDFANGFNTLFPSANFASLPTVSFVIPNLTHDMHDGTIGQGDDWLQTNIDAYAHWALANNSLLVVTWDEDDGTQNNQVPAILYGANVALGNYSTLYNHYNLLSTVLGSFGLTGPNNAATATQIQAFSGTGGITGGTTISSRVTGPLVLSPSDNPLSITSTGAVVSTGTGNVGIRAPSGTSWTIANAGTVSSAASYGIQSVGVGRITNTGSIAGTDGVGLLAGGAVTNGAAGSVTASVGVGINISGGAGTVENFGHISGSARGISLAAGGNLTNDYGASIVSNGNAGVFANGQAAIVVNSGSIQATGTNGTGVDLEMAGSLTNKSTGAISGSKFGVFLEGAFATLTNYGSIAAPTYDGVVLGLGGVVTNAAGAHVTGGNNGVYVKYRAAGFVTNSGSITALGANGAGVDLADGGVVTNTSSGTISATGSGSSVGIFMAGSAGTVCNYGVISGGHGVGVAAGGAVSNAAGAAIVGRTAGVFAQGATAAVTNAGSISATAGAGADIEAGGYITNRAGASIAGTSFGIFITGGSGTVGNAGTISGNSYAIHFGNNAGNRLIAYPGAVFSGAVYGGGGALELYTGGVGTIGGIGTVAFSQFQSLAVDTGADWTLVGGNTVGNVANYGTVDVAGTLKVSTAIDPASSGVFDLEQSAILEVAAATGANTPIAFLASSELIVDDFTTFGTNVGSLSYTGPQLQDFTFSDIVDIKNFAATNTTLSYDSTTGLLQIANGASQAATLKFQDSSLGAGAFHAVGDSSTGIFLTHS